MPRIRTVKPEFFSNEQVGQLPAEARLLFIGLWTLADREGRLQDRPMRIAAQLFPYDSWPIPTLLDNLAQADLIARYEAEGKKCIQIINFLKHQYPHPKETRYGLPAPPEGSRVITGNSREVSEMQPPSPVDSCINGSMDSGSMEHGTLSPTPLSQQSGEKTRERESKSTFSLKECEQYALTLKGIQAPKAYAKTIWRSGEDDEQIAAFLEPPKAQIAEIKKPVDVEMLQRLADDLDAMKHHEDAAALRAAIRDQ